ncbi:MAG: SPOR domain-containing protein [Pseudomonadota bacterium]
MSRYERSRKRQAARKRVLALFLVIVPLFAVLASFFIMNIYDGNKGIGIPVDGNSEDSNPVFEYNNDIGERTVYRLELFSTTDLGEAEDYLKGLKSKKLNGFILKEDGYKVIYGVFTSREQADKIQSIIAKKVEGSVSEIKFPGFSLRYNERDNAFIQLVQATDKLLWDIVTAKAELSRSITEQPKADTEELVGSIQNSEAKLERYLGYAEEVNVSKEQAAMRNDFEAMLKEVTSQRLDDRNNYFKIQSGIMNQIEAYRKYAEKLTD